MRVSGTDVPGTFLEVLDGEELAVLATRRRAEDQVSYAAAHWMLRLSLSEMVLGAVPPGVWRFDALEGEKPFIAEPEIEGLDFSLSHTRGWVACAVGRDARVGVDVEAVGPADVARELSARVLSPEERAGLEGLDDEALRQRFFALWTLKESYVKVTGEGMSAPLTEITYDPDGTGRLVAAPGADPARWSVYGGSLGGATPTHRWAVSAAPLDPLGSAPVLHLTGDELA